MSYPYPQYEPPEAEIASLSEHRERRITAERSQSRQAIGSLLEAVGLSPELAEGLEESAYRTGRVWRRSDV